MQIIEYCKNPLGREVQHREIRLQEVKFKS
jgi:hypothetical protein